MYRQCDMGWGDTGEGRKADLLMHVKGPLSTKQVKHYQDIEAACNKAAYNKPNSRNFVTIHEKHTSQDWYKARAIFLQVSEVNPEPSEVTDTNCA